MENALTKAKPKLDRAVTGRKKGTPNRVTALLKDSILKAAEEAGGPGGIVAYLRTQAIENPGPFMALLGKVLPTQVVADKDDELQVVIFKTTYEMDARGEPPILIEAQPHV
jgi:hypothetical protein